MAAAKSPTASPTFFATQGLFREWLSRHHTTTTELIVGFYRVDSGRPSMTWPESVDQALCFGWIDGVRRGRDEESYTIRFTPRKPKSIWSAINVAKVEALKKAKLMTAAGLAAYALRTAERTGVYSFERATEATFTGAEAKQLASSPKAAAFFAAQAPWYRRSATHWVVSPKKPETRVRRMAQLIDDSAAGRHVPPLRRPSRAP